MARLVDALRFRIRSLVQRGRADVDLDRELREHVERQTEENVARGMTPGEARRAALATFGGVQNVREEARDARGVAVIENLLRDFRYTLRALLREPMLLVAATLSIALGVGGNIAIFSLARAVVFAPPDARDPATLVNARVSHGSHVSYQRWRDLDAGGALERFAGYSIEGEVNWLDGGGTAAVSIVPMLVTANFFEVTGTPVARGRPFSATEARAELDPHLAVITDEFWQLRLGGDSAIIGRKLVINGEPYAVVGVLPPHLRSVAGFGIAPAVYLPLNRSLGPESRPRNASIVQLVGRLKPGQSLSEARTALDALDRRLARLAGDTLYGGVQEFAPVSSFRTGKEARTIGLFLAVLGFVSLSVLLIACANVAGLLIARGTRRRQEIAVRLAIGGSRPRLIQQLMVEGLWLALIGTAAGVGLSLVFMRVVNSLALPIPFPIALNLTADRAVLLCAIGLVALTLVTCALLPALQATRMSLVPALKREEPFYVVRRFSARGALLTGQVMISTILLVTAILFVRNLIRTQVTSPGFEVSHAVVAQIGFVQGGSDRGADRPAFLETAVDRVRSLPGVADVAYAASVPLTVHTGSSNGMSARIDGAAQTRHVEFSREIVGPRYFSTMGIRLLGGREFSETDAPGAPAVAVVNEVFARRYLGGKNPLGQRVQFVEDSSDFRVIGVVANSRMRTLGEDERAAVYVPLRQSAKNVRVGFVIARTQTEPTALVAPVRQALGALDKSVAVTVEPMASALQFALLPSRIGASVLGTLGMLGLVLAAFGLYALVSYSVSRRISEIAIRSALGASRGAVLRLVMRDATLHVGVGLGLGLAISAFITSPLSAFLVAGLSPTDPLSFGGTAVVFVLVSLLASWLPARLAMRVSPVVAMRLD